MRYRIDLIILSTEGKTGASAHLKDKMHFVFCSSAFLVLKKFVSQVQAIEVIIKHAIKINFIIRLFMDMTSLKQGFLC